MYKQLKRPNIFVRWMVIGLIIIVGIAFVKQTNGLADGASSTNLSDLSLNGGEVSFPFSSSTTDYAVEVPYKVTQVDVCPTLQDSTSTMTVNGSLANSGSTVLVSLKGGDNLITIVVTAVDGTTKNYTVKVTRGAASSNADLSGLNLSDKDGSAIPLTPSFSSNNKNYTTDVENRIDSINITPTTADDDAEVKVNDTSILKGSSTNVPLVVGENVITLKVTAENGTQKSYSIKVSRKKSSNANLSELTIDKGALTAPFSSDQTEYSVNVDNDVDNVGVTPTVEDSKATLVVNGMAVQNGSSANISLQVGGNEISIVVTAEDGTTKVYTVVVKRAASNNADLKSLTVGSGSLMPTFNKDVTKYAVTVGYYTSSLPILPKVDDANATLMVKKGNTNIPLEQGQFPVSLNAGMNKILIEVAAADGETKKVYEVDITRQYAPVEIPSITIASPTQGYGNVGQATVYINGNQLIFISTNPGETGVHIVKKEQHGDTVIVRYGLEKVTDGEETNTKLPLPTNVQHVVTILDDQFYRYFDNRYDVSNDQQWNVAFSMAMDKSTLNKQSLKVVDSRGNEVEMNFVIDKDVKNIKLVPKQPYKSGEVYLLTVNQNAKGYNGRPLKEPIRMIFIPR